MAFWPKGRKVLDQKKKIDIRNILGIGTRGTEIEMGLFKTSKIIKHTPSRHPLSPWIQLKPFAWPSFRTPNRVALCLRNMLVPNNASCRFLNSTSLITPLMIQPFPLLTSHLKFLTYLRVTVLSTRQRCAGTGKKQASASFKTLVHLLTAMKS